TKSRRLRPRTLLIAGTVVIVLAATVAVIPLALSGASTPLKPAVTIRVPANVESIAWSPDGHTIAAGVDWEVRTYDALTGKPLSESSSDFPSDSGLPIPTGEVRSVAWSPDGSEVVTGDDSHYVTVRDARTLSPIGRPFSGHADGVASVAWSPDGSKIASAS